MKTQKGYLVTIGEPNIKAEFMLNPDGFSDDKSTDYSKIKIPSISHPVYSYSSGGERKISFELIVTRDSSKEPNQTGPITLFGRKTLSTGIQMFGSNLPFRPNPRQPLASITGAIGRVPILGDLFQGEENPPEWKQRDITNDVAVLRSFLYPAHAPNTALKKTSPHLLLFHFGEYGFYGQGVTCVMTSCNIAWKVWSPDLVPLLAKVSIVLEEVVEQSITQENVRSFKPIVIPQSASKNRPFSDAASSILKTAVGVGAVAAIAVIGKQNPTGLIGRVK